MIISDNDCVFVFSSRILIQWKVYLIFRLLFVRSSNFWSKSDAFMFFFATHSLYFSDQLFHLIRIDDSLADFFLQDFLHFIDFVVIEKFRKRILWYDVVVFSSFIRFQVKDMKYIMNAIKWEKNHTIRLFIHCFNDAKWFYEFMWEFLTWIFNLMFLINNIIKFSVLKFSAICFRL